HRCDRCDVPPARCDGRRGAPRRGQGNPRPCCTHAGGQHPLTTAPTKTAIIPGSRDTRMTPVADEGRPGSASTSDRHLTCETVRDALGAWLTRYRSDATTVLSERSPSSNRPSLFCQRVSA